MPIPEKRRIWLVASSPNPQKSYLEAISQHLNPEDLIYGVDGGFQIALQQGWIPYAFFGDGDSVALDLVKNYALIHADLEVHIFSTDKDASDLEIALRHAVKKMGFEIIIINGMDGRSDHTLFNFLLCSIDPTRIHIWDTEGTFMMLRPQSSRIFKFAAPTTFSLIPFQTCKGVCIQNAKYPLDHENIGGSSRTLSNITIQDSETIITFEAGLLGIYFVGHYL